MDPRYMHHVILFSNSIPIVHVFRVASQIKQIKVQWIHSLKWFAYVRKMSIAYCMPYINYIVKKQLIVYRIG